MSFDRKLGILNFSVTNKCNLRCKKCNVPLRFKKDEEMSTAEIMRVIDDASKLGVKWISLTGGEPLTRPDIFKIIRYVHKKNIKVLICTNGTLITKDIARKLANAGLDKASVSIDGPKKIHDWMCGKGNFDKSTSAVKYLLTNKINVGLGVVITKQNYFCLSKILTIAFKLSVKRVTFQPFDESFLKNKLEARKFMLNSDEIKKLRKEIEKIKTLSKKYDIETTSEEHLEIITKYFAGDRKVASCFAPFFSCVILPNGDLQGCWSTGYVGNVKKHSLIDLFNSKRYNNICKLALKGKCPGCVARCRDMASLSFYIKPS